MTETTNFYFWYFDGLGGLGGWFLFFLVAVIAVVWLYFDSSRRRIPASGWKLGIVLSACLMIPTLIWRFGGVDTRLSIAQFDVQSVVQKRSNNRRVAVLRSIQ